MKHNYLYIGVLFFILIIGLLLRLAGLNWDQDGHLHPDERFLTMVTQALVWPSSPDSYFSTSRSTANPHNVGYPFYVYGTFPLFITKLAAQVVALDSYNGITLVGRFLSAILDAAIIILVWAISYKITKQKAAALFSAFFYSISVLPIQLSHFYAVDTFMVAGLFGGFYFIHRYLRSEPGVGSIINMVSTGAMLGLSAASKISVVLFLPVVIISLFLRLKHTKNWLEFFLAGLVFAVSLLAVLRLAQPYLFTGFIDINPKVIANWQQLKTFEDSSGWYPPSVQWIPTLPVLFPLENLFLWGLGLAMATTAVLGIIYALVKSKHYPQLVLHLVWIIGLFVYQSIQFAKPMRYFYPLYPSLAIVAGPVLLRLFGLLRFNWQRGLLIVSLVIWPLAFVSVYSRPHPRVEATAWIYRNLPAGSTLSCEYWDDCLPLGDGSMYNIIQLPLYDSDNAVKWERINYDLDQIDYIILTSNRLYGSIMSVPAKYPATTKFYFDLFSGHLGFKKIAEFTSRPNLPLPGIQICLTPPHISYGKVAFPYQECPLSGISFVDDYADESWTVYDHPKVIIFSRQLE